MTATPTTVPSDPRTVLARIALADAPVPNAVHFYPATDGWPKPILSFDLATLADAFRWAELLGAKPSTSTSETTGLTHFRHGPAAWLGWTVALHASQDAAATTDLDDATRDGLAALIGGAR